MPDKNPYKTITFNTYLDGRTSFVAKKNDRTTMEHVIPDVEIGNLSAAIDILYLQHERNNPKEWKDRMHLINLSEVLYPPSLDSGAPREPADE